MLIIKITYTTKCVSRPTSYAFSGDQYNSRNNIKREEKWKEVNNEIVDVNQKRKTYWTQNHLENMHDC